MTGIKQIEATFARELARALGEHASSRVDIERVVLDAPQSELSRPDRLRELAQATARQLRARVRGNSR
jgi:hypothetical protein